MKRTAIYKPLRVAVTGHRKFNKSKSHEEWKLQFIDAVAKFVEMVEYVGIERERLVFLSGCALGVDIWFATYAYKSEINYELYLPFPRITQIVKGNFNPLQVNNLNTLITNASKVVVVNRTFYPYGYQVRNKALIDNSHMLLTFYQRKNSGSGNCERYAIEKQHWIVDLMRLNGIQDLPFCLNELVS